jgi:glycosyltransferase involved in cell wall biosynthesis
MRVSVVIPCHNRAAKLQHAVGSVLGQQLAPGVALEMIVVDDASEPPIAAVPEANARVVRLERNLGPAGARNRGIAAATGEYLAFLDSDDAWLPDKLARQLTLAAELEREHDMALQAIVCGFVWPNRITGAPEARIPRPPSSGAELASGCWFSPGSTLLIHRSAFERVGPLDERLRRLEDLDWFIRFGRLRGRLHVVPAVGALIVPSHSAGIEALAAPVAVLREKFIASGEVALQPAVRRRLRAYLRMEQCAAAQVERNWPAVLWHLAISQALVPRPRLALGDFWEQGATIAPPVLDLYRQLAARGTAEPIS